MAKAPRERVRLTAPSGRFTVFVSPTRADALRGRGYTDAAPVREITSTGTTAPGGDRRAALIERAKELGIPAKGTNAALEAAIAKAEG